MSLPRRAVGAAAALGALLALPAAAPAQVPVGSFYYFERADPRTGKDLSSATTVAAENFVTGAGGLTWQCRGGELAVTVTSTYLGRSMRARVRWRFDDDAPSPVQEWILRSTGMAVTAPREVAADFTARAMKADQLVVQVADYQFLQHEYTFALAGLPEALSRLSCGP